jgi:ribose/xylose/arabinose/galactoside ABC-type transport system permease subunit
VAAVFSIAEPQFLSGQNFIGILLAMAIYGIMVCGAIYPILLGGIDLSVGGVAALSGACVVMTTLQLGSTDFGVFVGIVAGLAAGAIIGLVQGLIIANFRVPAFLVTIAMQYIVYGLCQILNNNSTISLMGPESFTFIGSGRPLGIPFPIFILAFMAIVSFLILNFTVIGRRVYAVGGNPTASELSGISSKKVIYFSYMFSSFACAIAGIVLASFNKQTIPKAGMGYENDVITAIVVGGTSLMGGEGTIQGAILGALLVGVVSNGLLMIGVPAEFNAVVKGIIIIVAVSLDARSRVLGSGLVRMSRLRLFSKKTVKE